MGLHYSYSTVQYSTVVHSVGVERERRRASASSWCLRCAQIKKEMRDFEANSALVEEERAKKLRELERKQKAISAEADECEQSITQVSKIIDQLRTGT